jgi:hypothetical protein
MSLINSESDDLPLLAQCQQLRTLNLTDCYYIFDLHPECPWPRLEELNLTRRTVSERSYREFIRLHPHVRVIGSPRFGDAPFLSRDPDFLPFAIDDNE